VPLLHSETRPHSHHETIVNKTSELEKAIELSVVYILPAPVLYVLSFNNSLRLLLVEVMSSFGLESHFHATDAANTSGNTRYDLIT
jgi:hypothetical protein